MGDVTEILNKFTAALDNATGEDGVKMDITADLPTKTYWYLGSTIVGSVLVSFLLLEVAKRIVR